MDRASDYESAGRVFESPWAHQFNRGVSHQLLTPFLFLCVTLCVILLKLPRKFSSTRVRIHRSSEGRSRWCSFSRDPKSAGLILCRPGLYPEWRLPDVAGDENENIGHPLFCIAFSLSAFSPHRDLPPTGFSSYPRTCAKIPTAGSYPFFHIAGKGLDIACWSLGSSLE
jgi:hypothetical protein